MTFEELYTLSILMEGSAETTKKFWPFFVRIVTLLKPVDYTLNILPDAWLIASQGTTSYVFHPSLIDGIDDFNDWSELDRNQRLACSSK